MLRGKYGEPSLKVIIGNKSVLGPKDSIWWCGIVQSGWFSNYGENMFTGVVVSSVNNSCNTTFWYSKCLGN